GAARIDASGDAGGGTVLVGGDAHGAGERRASSTYVGSAAVIDASATTRGNGGKVVVWADGATRFLGRINARGGLLGGNGGFAEVSGARHLDYLGLADLSAPSGAKGLLLLDPSNIEIVARTADANKTGAATPAAAPDNDLLATDDASSDPGLQFFATSGAADSVSKISAGAVVAQLDTADVQLAATHDITVSAAIDASANANSHGLTLTAGSGASDAVILKADVISKGGLVLQGRQIQVADNDVTLDAGSGKLSLEAAVDGGGKSLSLVSGNGAADAVKTGGAIGNVAALTVTGKSTLGGSVTTTGAQRYSGLVTLGTAGAYTFAGSALSFNGLAAGANDLVFRADSALVVTGALSGTGHVSIAGQSADRALSVGGPTASPDDLEISNSTLALFGTGFAGVSIGRADGTGAITFADYTLTRDLSVRNGTGAIRFGRLDGGFALTAQTDGIITLGGDIGTSSATRSLDFNGAVALAQSVTIKADSVSFGATVDSADATPRGLTLNAPTGVRFGGAVGQTHALAALDVSSAETRVAGDVTVAAGGHQVYSGNVVLDGDATFKAPTLTFGGSVAAGDHDLGVLADSPVLPAGGMTGNKRLTVGAFTDSTTIGVDGGAGTLQVATSGGFTRVTVGSATGTGEINLGATGGAAVDLSKDLTLQSASGNINVNTQVDGAHSLTLTTGGVVTIGAGVGGNTALTALTTGGAGGTTRLNANVTTSGDQTYGHAVVIGTTVRTQAGSTEAPATVRFASTVDSASGGAGSLTVTGNARFDAAVGAVQRLASLSVSGAAQLGGNISTTGSQTYVGAVTLGQAVSLDSSSSYIYFPAGSSVDGAFDLTLTSASASYLYGSVGATTPLGSLTVNGLAYVSAAAVNTSGAQTYASLVTAFNSSTTFTGSDVAFNGGLSSSGDVNVDASGTATVGGASVSVANLGVSHAALINTASVTTTGAQTYGGDVTLGATTALSGNTIRFNGTVRAAANGAQGLTVNDSGTTTFTGDVGGGGHALASLTTSAGGKTVLPGQVTTTGAQSYGDVAQLAVATTLQAGSVRFDAGLLGGNQGLTVSLPTAGTLLFKVSVADLGGLVVDGDATTLTSFDGTGGLATSGEQRYGGAVAILDGGDARFVASALRFGGKVSGARNLVLNADTIAAGELAGTGELQVAPSSAGRSIDLTGGAADVSIDLNRVSGFTQRTIGRADGTGAITAGALHLGGDTTVQSGTGNLNFNGAIDGPYALTAQTGGGVAFGGDIGGDPANPLGPKALSRLNVSSGQALTLGKVYLSGGGTIQTAGQLELTDKLQLDGGTLTLASTAAPGAGSAIIDADGKPSDQLLLDNRPLREAAAAISQTGGAVVTAAGTTLDLRASGGGSIVVDSAANDIKGNLSAVSGTPGEAGGARFALGATPLVLGAIRLQSSQMHAAGIEGDVVRLTAGSLNTVAGTKIRARLPYVNAQGALTSMPALTLVPTQPALVNQFGAAASSSWIQVEVGDATGGYLTVRPKGAGAGSSAVYLGGADGLVPFYDGAGKASEIQVYYNGRTPSTPQEVGALSAVTSVIEESRRSRFEEVVRTENVSARLRTGVIAEVGSGRPATVGSESIRLPASCTPNNRLGC
uniref:beta strand repeat-containing protein n=1 Tax=Aquabacterium sp. TaxID=1872578 RepID=UPI0035AE4CEA